MKIKIENLNFAHALEQTINDFTAIFNPGKFYSLLGPNGSGKTTFFDLLTGYLKPDSGNIFFDKQNILSLSSNEIARKTALVSQDYYINFPYTVREIVTMGRHPYMGRFFSADKEDVNIINAVANLTEINSLMNRDITCLSGGERQRCVFARALCQKTPILLLDEAFSNMDIHHSFNLLKNLKKEIKNSNITIIAVFHDINFASIWSDEMIFLKKGNIIASGTPEDILTEETIKQAYEMEVEVEYNKFSNAKQVYFSTR